jgi:hypothetical protein
MFGSILPHGTLVVPSNTLNGAKMLSNFYKLISKIRCCVVSKSRSSESVKKHQVDAKHWHDMAKIGQQPETVRRELVIGQQTLRYLKKRQVKDVLGRKNDGG